MKRYLVYILIIGTFCYVFGQEAGTNIRTKLFATHEQSHQSE